MFLLRIHLQVKRQLPFVQTTSLFVRPQSTAHLFVWVWIWRKYTESNLYTIFSVCRNIPLNYSNHHESRFLSEWLKEGSGFSILRDCLNATLKNTSVSSFLQEKNRIDSFFKQDVSILHMVRCTPVAVIPKVQRVH